MHMRHKKWARPELGACPYYRDAPTELSGKWRGVFPAGRPLHVELGCGKGVSTAEMVRANPDVNYVAIDITCDILGDARRNIQAAFDPGTPDNVCIVRYDVEYIDRLFGPEDAVERIYVSFCNPWTERPKYAKRRLTHPRQLLQYRTFLTEEGEIWFKTDDDALWRDSLRYFEVSGFRPRFVTEDLHASGFSPNYVTEHEAKFSAMGIPIKMGVFQKAPLDAFPDALRWGLSRGRYADAPAGQEEE